MFSTLDEEWIKPWVDAPYSELITRPQCLSLTDVGACLRQPEVPSIAKTYPKISRVRHWRKNLFETTGKSAVIDELWLEKFPDYYGGKRRFSVFQIFGSGGEVHCISDSESSDH
jgi:hypothetical protein